MEVFMKRILNVSVVFLFIVFSVWGAGKGEQTGGKAKDANGNGRYDKMVLNTSADPGDFMPYNPKANQKLPLYMLIYDCLFDLIDGQYIPDAAESFVKTNPLYWDVKLYSGIKDWNGNPITADDVVNTYNRFVASGFALTFADFKSIEKLDDLTVRFHWNNEPVAVAGLSKIFCEVMLVADEEWNKDNGASFATKPVGSGQYKLVSYTSGSKIVFEANDDYWQKDASKINPLRQRNVDRIEYDVITESAQNVVALRTGTITMCTQVPNENLEEFRSKSSYLVQNFMTNNCTFLTCNQSAGNVLEDINLRLAIYYAIDGTSLAKAAPGWVPCIGFAGSDSADFVKSWANEKTYFNTSDVSLAKQYLLKSNYKGENLRLMGINLEDYKIMMTLIQAQLDQIGIKCTINAVTEVQQRANIVDASAWDFMLGGAGGGFVINAMNKMLNNNEYKGQYCVGFRYDAELQKLFEAANNQSTWNSKTMDAVYQYVVKNAVAYTIDAQVLSVVTTSDISNLYKWDMYILPSACTYKL
jgi:ABC-type transport system substrate-binding protein